MQKKIIALAIAAVFAAPVAMADTANVNVYGSIDGGMRNQSGGNMAGGTQDITSSFSSGVFNSNRWGFKGSEDLGDGMKAGFGLEGGFNTATGAGAATLFDRNATVFIESGLGKLELGRQFSVAFKTIGTYDPFGFKFIGLTQAAAASINNRHNGAYSYTGKFAGVTVMAEHAPSASATAVGTTGNINSVGATYALGDLNLGAAYSNTTMPSNAQNNNSSTNYYTLGAGYKLGDAKVSVGYALNKVSRYTDPAPTTDSTSKFHWVGASYAITSKIGVTAAVYRNATIAAVLDNNAALPQVERNSTLAIVGATYALSKRTTAYVEMDRTQFNNGNGDAVAGSTNKADGTSIGLSTTF